MENKFNIGQKVQLIRNEITTNIVSKGYISEITALVLIDGKTWYKLNELEKGWVREDNLVAYIDTDEKFEWYVKREDESNWSFIGWYPITKQEFTHTRKYKDNMNVMFSAADKCITRVTMPIDKYEQFLLAGILVKETNK